MTIRKSFLLHLDSLEILDELTDEQAGKLLKLFRDFNLGKEVNIEADLKLVFSFFKNQFIRDSEKYKVIVDRNRSNGKVKKKKKASGSHSHPMAPNGTHSTPLAAYNDNDNDNVSENIKSQQERFLDWFNQMIEKYSGKKGRTSVLSKTDENNLKKLRKSYPKVDDWEIVFRNMWNSQWCIDTNNRTATHLLRLDNFNKYLSQENPFSSKKKMAMVFGELTDISEMDPLYVNVNRKLGNLVDV